jgi:hypothetical protein
MTSAAARTRRHRQRQAAGLIVVAVEIDEVRATEVLVAAGLLDPMVDHSREAISRAVERLVELLARDDKLPGAGAG